MGSHRNHCPYCGSENIHSHGEEVDIIEVKGEPFEVARVVFECEDCDEVWSI